MIKVYWITIMIAVLTKMPYFLGLRL